MVGDIMKYTALSLGTGLALLMATPATADKFHCRSSDRTSPYPVEMTGQHDHLRYAPATIGLDVREFAAYTAVFDGTDDDNGDGTPDLTANPTFVAYHLRGVRPDSNGAYREPDVSIERPGDWYRAPDLDFLWTNRPSVSDDRIDNSYDGIGRTWNRGHLAMADHAQRISAEASCNTHFFWNASPQAAEFNQGPWLHLETYSAAVSNSAGEAWIMAGPIFDAGRDILYIGDNGEVPVAVPHAFFKIIVVETRWGVQTRSFIYEHPSSVAANGHPGPDEPGNDPWVKCSSATNGRHDYNHADNLVSIATIEARTGLRFMPNITDRDTLVAAEHDDLWPIPANFWTGFICGGQREA